MAIVTHFIMRSFLYSEVGSLFGIFSFVSFLSAVSVFLKGSKTSAVVIPGAVPP